MNKHPKQARRHTPKTSKRVDTPDALSASERVGKRVGTKTPQTNAQTEARRSASEARRPSGTKRVERVVPL